MIHRFPHDIQADIIEKFTDPFRYVPHPLVRYAAEMLICRIGSEPDLHNAFSEGKMAGVLIVRDTEGRIGYLAGFSGNVGGRSRIPGFVPPIFDLMESDGEFKKGEKELDDMTAEIRELEESADLYALYRQLDDAERYMQKQISEMKAMIAIAKRERDEIRSETQDPSRLNDLIRESQYHKAELRRIKEKGKAAINEIEHRIKVHKDKIAALKQKRALKSDQLQKWIFRQYVVSDAHGHRKPIGDIFADAGLVPPGGTGECAAPKLLEYAYDNGLVPLAMGEFWYGRSPETVIRTHGHFYPSCTSRCGLLLTFMMKGLTLADSFEEMSPVSPEVIYEDKEIIVVEKPSGMPSVPGLNGKKSLLEILSEKYGKCISLHRLDMDTSGVMLYAKTPVSAARLQKQFEEHTVKKTYKARLSPEHENNCFNMNVKKLQTGDKGMIELPLAPDYDERPRQKVDRKQGKHASTEYEVISVNEDSTIDILFRPKTGRTHQLRVHSAHISGLGHPILGDMLYGGCTETSSVHPQRLHLHAFSISFIHPATEEELTFSSECHIY